MIGAQMVTTAVLLVHVGACGLLAVFGVHRVWLLVDWLRARRARAQRGPIDLAGEPPRVTVQLPLYNEEAVLRRLVNAACALDWPRDRLQVQVLDDSDDGSDRLAAELVDSWRARGVDAVHVRREDRGGYKAGALGYGLQRASGELVAIFDADFVPPSDFLRRTVPAFVDPEVGMVQARWGHLNRDASVLTRAQAVFLDAHFTIEHSVRESRGRFFNFNGTAGVWRRSAIERAGGWDAATLTEDLDLSFRAQLAGARFTYLDDVEVPAELPDDVNAFKGQQHRWAKGSIQTARLLLGRVWRAPLPLSTRLDATLKLLSNVAFLLLAIVVCTMPVIGLLRALGASAFDRAGDLMTLGLATLPVAVHFLVAARARGRSWLAALASVPLALGLGAALSVNNARAVIEGLFGRGGDEFVRTPKRGARARRTYRSPVHPLVLVELALGTLHVVAAVLLVAAGHAWTTPFLWLFGVSLLSLGASSAAAAVAPLFARADRAPSPS
jgi:hypothetical protein